jgi:hypothetical protein
MKLNGLDGSSLPLALVTLVRVPQVASALCLLLIFAPFFCFFAFCFLLFAFCFLLFSFAFFCVKCHRHKLVQYTNSMFLI